jgi:hypothetical protein
MPYLQKRQRSERVNAKNCIDKIGDYFTGKQNPAVTEQITLILERLGEQEIDAVYDRLLQEVSPRFSVGVKEIADACNALGIGFHKAHFIPAHDWVCDACGQKFLYSPGSDDDDKIDKHIFDICPGCGFQVNWTITAKKYRTFPDWYNRELTNRMAWKCDHPEPYFNQAVAEQERRDQKRIDVTNKIAKLAADMQSRLPYKD